MLYRASLGNGKISLMGLAVDSSGNAYVAGSASDPLPVAATPLDYTQTGTQQHGLILKFDPTGANLFNSAFANLVPAALALDGAGNLWGAGANLYATQVFQLNSTGGGFTHFLSVPSDASAVGGLSVDTTGRPLLALASSSVQIPNFAPLYNTDGTAGNATAGFLRLASKLTQADVQVRLTTASTAVGYGDEITFTIQLTNAGPDPATDVQVVFPGFTQGLPTVVRDIVSCQATGSGVCERDGLVWWIAYPALSPGETESVQFSANVEPITAPYGALYPFAVGVLTSADDPNQTSNNAYVALPAQTISLEVVAQPGLNLDTDLTSSPAIIFGNGNVPTVAGPVTLYVPTPQFIGGSGYVFTSWSDSVTDNPRTFVMGPNFYPYIGVNVRKITEPWMNPDVGVVNAASYRTGSAAPGEILSVFGYNLGPATGVPAALDSSGRIATTLSGFSATFDGTPAPIVYTSSGQTSFIVPYEVAGKNTAQLVMKYNGLTSASYAVNIAVSAPGLFTAASSGGGQLAAFLADFSANSTSHPVTRGDVVVMYATGEGTTNPTPTDGQIAGGTAPMPQLPVSVMIGGQSAQVLYAGGVPGSTAGLMQINAIVPPGIATGLVPVLVTIGTNTSQREATIAVQ
jgi:uncharacterized protein (TIGR03437 family)